MIEISPFCNVRCREPSLLGYCRKTPVINAWTMPPLELLGNKPDFHGQWFIVVFR